MLQSCFLLSFLIATILVENAQALASRKPFKADLQKCYTPQDVLKLVGETTTTKTTLLSPSDASLALVRLSKQLVVLDNRCRHSHEDCLDWKDNLLQFAPSWNRLGTSLAQHEAATKDEKNSAKRDALVEGIKSISVVTRLVPKLATEWYPCLEQLDQSASQIIVSGLEAHQLSGLRWAYDCLGKHMSNNLELPSSIQRAHDEADLPFRLLPGSLVSEADLTVARLAEQANFRMDDIRTSSNRVVKERRKTAWEGDDGVEPFSYSGKSMETNEWSPLVRSVRDELQDTTGVYYDGCLLNLYPDGGSGMRYHSDPDQGVLWDYSTAVVSLGATRKFSFREIESSAGSKKSSQNQNQNQNQNQQQQQPHTFVLMQGDVTEMFGNCQTRYQHTVRTADDKHEKAARASLVFKRTLHCKT